MNGFDLVVASAILFGAAIGAWIGIVRAAVGTVAMTSAGLAGLSFAPRLEPHITRVLGSQRVASMVGFLFTVAAVLMIFGVVAWVIRKSLRALGLSWIDRGLGAIIAVTTVIAASSFTAYGFVRRAPEARFLHDSLIVQPLAKVADLAIGAAPPWVRARIDRIVGGVERKSGFSEIRSSEASRNCGRPI